MSPSLAVWLALAIGLFWSVGVYNRLMRMRARAWDAFGSVEKHLQQYAEVVHAHFAAWGVSAMDTALLPVPWQSLVRCLEHLNQSLKEAKKFPLAATPIARVAGCLIHLHDNWESLRRLPLDLAGSNIPAELELQWDAISQKVEIARGGLNQIILKYNEALKQYPARLIVGALGFETAGIL